MLFKQIVRSAAPARRQLSTSAPRLAGFGTAGKDEKAIPASKSTLSDQQSATGSDLHEKNKGDASKAGANAKHTGTTASKTADPASASPSMYNKGKPQGGLEEEAGVGGSDIRGMAEEVNKEKSGKMSSDPLTGENLRSERGVSN